MNVPTWNIARTPTSKVFLPHGARVLPLTRAGQLVTVWTFFLAFTGLARDAIGVISCSPLSEMFVSILVYTGSRASS